MDRVVNATFVLARPEDVAGMNEEWLRSFADHLPARSGAKHPAPAPGMLISIAAIAEA
jgi:enamine deaminase RidA (YjgF/YER057c/UK114 family)